MAYDENLAERIKPVIEKRPGFTEKHMFGGVGFLLNGNMCCGVYQEFLICRLGGSPSR
jgi:TfoX/Sxy family transcriptional regulator of competence genes